jgi:acyl-CoA dehydrogenase
MIAGNPAESAQAREEWRARVREAAAVAAKASAAVDRDARFPHEALERLRESQMLGALAPAELGGEDRSFGEIARALEILAGSCASTAMIYAMHQIQLSCLIRHGHRPTLRAFTSEVVRDQLLLGSATSESGTAGDMLTSTCWIDTDGKSFTLEKSAPVVSYAEQADALLVTARRDRDAASTDQVLVACRRPDIKLTRAAEWDAMGMRGTCSHGYQIRVDGSPPLVLDVPFRDILSHTMLPVSHTMWAAVWLGVATEAVSRTRRHAQSRARSARDHQMPGGSRLAIILARHQQFRALVHAAADRLDAAGPGGLGLATTEAAMAMNSLKISAAALAVDITSQALLAIGMAGYQETGEFSISRLLRDAYSASIMVNDDRIADNTAQLLLMYRESLT